MGRRMKLHSLTIYTKINSKWIKNLNVRQESIKIPEENIRSNLFNISHSNFFQDMSPKAKETKAKMNFWDFIKIKSFCTAKETVNKTKRQPMEWEKIFANDTTDKELISTIYKNSSNSTHTKQIIISKNGQKICTDTSPMKTYKWLPDT